MTRQEEYGSMTIGDAQKLYMHIEKQQILNGYKFPTKPSKDGYYRIYVPDVSKKNGRRQLFAKSIEELEDAVYEFEKNHNTKRRKSFKDVFEISIDEKLRYIKNPDKLLSSQNTVNKIRSDYNRFFTGTEFENRFIDALTKAEIEDIIYFNLTRYDLRDKAVNAMKSILRSVFRLAFCQYWITDNVFERVDFNKFSGMIAPNVDVSKRAHSDEDLRRILDELHAHQKQKPHYIPAYALEMQILCAARRGEIPPLRFSDIHDKYIAISREQLTVKKFNDIPEYNIIVEHTKTYKDRHFPRYAALNEFLARFQEVHDRFYPDTDYLFPANTPTGVISNKAVYDYYLRILKKLNIKVCKDEIKGTHSFRRNAITDVVNASGGNIVMASKMFGNSPAVANNNYYTGLDFDQAAAVLDTRKFS